MRLLILQTELFESKGGVQTFNRTLIRAAGDLSVDLELSTEVLVLNDREVSNHLPPYLGPRTRVHAYARSKARFIFAALRASARTDVLIVTHVNLSPLARVIRAIRPHVRICVVVHGIDVWRRLPASLRSGMAAADRILSVSQYTLDVMTQANGPQRTPPIVFPCTLDSVAALAHTAPDYSALPPGPFVLSVARLAPTERRKGIDSLIRAMPALLTNVPDAHYVVAGAGADKERLARLASELGVGERVKLLGRVSDSVLNTLYSRCTVFALPSTKEGFGIVFLEAMSHGKPCVGARAGGIPEVVVEGETGLLVPPDDSPALAHCLTRLLRDRELAARLGAAGRSRYEAEFSRRSFARRLGALLESLRSAPRPTRAALRRSA